MSRAPQPAVVIDDAALEQFAASRPAEPLLVMDTNTRAAAGARLQALLDHAEVLVLDARGDLHAGPEEAGRVAERITQQGDAVTPVAVGSGVITDIVRYASHSLGRDFVSVPTAASMDGYSSSVAAMQIDGLKLTTPARAPTAIYADPRVLAAAPQALTRAGIGDLLGKATAGVDWLAAHLLYGERYDESIAAATRRTTVWTAANVPGLLSGDPGKLRALLEGLIGSGVAIARMGNSRPASGSEHHASHFWDLLAARGLLQHGSHGLQVGFATGLCMRLQRFAFDGGGSVPRLPTPDQDPLTPAAVRWLGAPTEELRGAVARKRALTATPPATWPCDEPAWRPVQAALAEAMKPFPDVERALRQAGFAGEPGPPTRAAATETHAALPAGETGGCMAVLDATFRYSPWLRDRYTTIDFLRGQGLLTAALQTALGHAV